MNKRIPLIVLLLIMLGTSLFGEMLTWMTPYQAGFNVNLEDTEKYSGAANSGTLSDGKGTSITWDTGGYTDDTMVCLIGVSKVEKLSNEEYPKIKIEVTVNSHNSEYPWHYVSASEPFIRRPFALDFIKGYKGGPKENRELTRIGIGGDDENPVTLILDLDTYSTDEAWCDIVLVLPKQDNSIGSDLSYALSTNDYFCSLSIKMYKENNTGGFDKIENAEWGMSFNGYIREAPDKRDSIVLVNVVPLPAAYAIDIDNQRVDLRAGTLQIGTFSIETGVFLDTRVDPNDPNKYSLYHNQIGNEYCIFASSIDDPFDRTGGEKFRLVLDGFESYPSDELDDVYEFNYEVGLSYGSQEKWYDGTTYVSEDSSNDLSNLLQAERKEQTVGDTHSDIGDNVLKRDSVYYQINDGDIKIRVPNTVTEEQLNNLVAGVYSSEIYFHVVSLK